MQCDLSQLEDAVEQCAELMGGSTSCEELGEGIVEESAVRGARALPVPVAKLLCGAFGCIKMLPCHRRLLIHSRARSRATGGPGGGGDLAALRLLSHDTDVDAWGTCWCSDMHLDPFDACD